MFNYNSVLLELFFVLQKMSKTSPFVTALHLATTVVKSCLGFVFEFEFACVKNCFVMITGTTFKGLCPDCVMSELYML